MEYVCALAETATEIKRFRIFSGLRSGRIVSAVLQPTGRWCYSIISTHSIQRRGHQLGVYRVSM